MSLLLLLKTQITSGSTINITGTFSILFTTAGSATNSILGTGTSRILSSTSGAVQIKMSVLGTTSAQTQVNGSAKSSILASAASAINTISHGLLGQRFLISGSTAINFNSRAALGKTLNLSSTIDIINSILGNLEFLGPLHLEPQIVAINNGTLTNTQTPNVSSLILTKIGNVPLLTPTIITLPRTNPGMKASGSEVIKPAAENTQADQLPPPKLKPQF